MAEEEQVQQSTEATDEVEEETTGTDEAETSEDTSEETETSEESSDDSDDSGDHTELTKAQKVAQDQKKRAEKAEAEAKRLKDKYEPPSKKEDKVAALEERTAKAEERATRAELAAAGFKHPDDQKYILDAAKRLGVEPLDAAGDELVAGKLKRMGEARATKDATPAPSGRGGKPGGTDVGKLADKVAAGGALPSDPALAEKVQSELARRSHAGA